MSVLIDAGVRLIALETAQEASLSNAHKKFPSIGPRLRTNTKRVNNCETFVCLGSPQPTVGAQPGLECREAQKINSACPALKLVQLV